MLGCSDLFYAPAVLQHGNCMLTRNDKVDACSKTGLIQCPPGVFGERMWMRFGLMHIDMSLFFFWDDSGAHSCDEQGLNDDIKWMEKAFDHVGENFPTQELQMA